MRKRKNIGKRISIVKSPYRDAAKVVENCGGSKEMRLCVNRLLCLQKNWNSHHEEMKALLGVQSGNELRRGSTSAL
jgi:hypothetical protein